MASRVELTGPAGFMKTRWWPTIEHWLHEGSLELGQLEEFNVMKRTPVLTGALQADVHYRVGSPNSELLANIYSDTTEQVAEWNRVYMLYQEGGTLGLATYTNGPHEMYARIMTDDIGDIETWGLKWLQKAADEIVAGRIIP